MVDCFIKKVQRDNDQDEAQSERNSHFKNRGGNKVHIVSLWLRFIDGINATLSRLLNPQLVHH